MATFVNETSDSTHQDTTFVVKEIVYNPSGELPAAIEVKPGGEMEYRVSTYVACCACGLSLPRQDIGQDYLLPVISKRRGPTGLGFSTCDVICKTEDGSCAELAEDLRSGNGVAISDA